MQSREIANIAPALATMRNNSEDHFDGILTQRERIKIADKIMDGDTLVLESAWALNKAKSYEDSGDLWRRIISALDEMDFDYTLEDASYIEGIVRDEATPKEISYERNSHFGKFRKTDVGRKFGSFHADFTNGIYHGVVTTAFEHDGESYEVGDRVDIDAYTRKFTPVR